MYSHTLIIRSTISSAPSTVERYSMIAARYFFHVRSFIVFLATALLLGACGAKAPQTRTDGQ
jgi:hypothetical protein